MSALNRVVVLARLAVGGMLLACCLPAVSQAAVVAGQVDTFQDGTTDAWTNGGSNAPVNVADGGPLGVGDSFLRISADGSGGGGRLVAFNRSQWAGNFVAAGVTAVEMDLMNPNGAALPMRIALKDGVGPGAGGYASTNAFVLPADGLWHHAVFGLGADSLTGVGSPATLAAFLATVAEFRLLSANAPALNGATFVGSVHVDNLTAVAAVPVPAAFWLFGSALTGLLGVARRRRV